MKYLFLFFIISLFASCSNKPSKSEAEDLVRQRLTENNDMDGGGTTDVYSINILSTKTEGDHTIIYYLWSGSKSSPALNNPSPPKNISNEDDSLMIEKKGAVWQLRRIE